MRTPLSAIALLTLFACDDGDGTDTDIDTDTDTGTEMGTEVETTDVSGNVTDAQGNALSGVRVNMCRQVCLTATTDEAGDYVFDGGLVAQRYSFHIETLGDLSQVDGSVPYTVEDTDAVVLDVIVPTATPIAIPSARAEVEPAADLLLTVGAGDLTILFEDDPTEIAAVRVGMDEVMPIDIEGDIAAVWYLDPWSADADPAVGLRIRDTFGASGDTYTLFQANYDDAAWDTLGTLTSDGDFVTGDIALSRLDTLVLVSESAR